VPAFSHHRTDRGDQAGAGGDAANFDADTDKTMPSQASGAHGILASSSGELVILSLLIATMVGAIAVLKRARVP
jgi:hypothetical protein